MAKLKLRPLDDRVVVEPLEAEEMTAGGIVLPDAAQEKPQRGKVIATGPGKLLDSGNRGELSVKIGDEVIFGRRFWKRLQLTADLRDRRSLKTKPSRRFGEDRRVIRGLLSEAFVPCRKTLFVS